MLHANGVGADRELGHIGGDRELAFRGDARREIAALRAGDEERGAISARREATRDGRGQRFGIVVGEPGILEHEHHIGAARRELRGERADSGAAREHRMDLAAR